MSETEDNNDAFLGEEADGTTATESSAGRRRRPTTERSSSDLPKPKKAKKKQAHRAEVWQHYIEKEDLVGVARCRYCSQQIGCDTKLHGTSSMKSHLQRCKFFKAHQDLGTQKVLAGDMRGAITTVPYDKALFRSYMVITAHWIDRGWDLQKRIIWFKPVTDHKGDTIADHLRACLEEWGIKKESEEENGESGPEGAKKRVGPPTSKGWDDVQRLVKFLKIFFNCTLAFSATKTVTSTICYHEIVLIERSLINLSINDDQELRLEAMDMRAKLEKYWDGLINMNPLVIIASVFDPRNKMQFANICFDKLYGKDSLESDHLKSSIKKLMKNLFEEYVQRLCNNSQAESTGNKSGEVDDLAPLFEEDDELESRDSLYDEMATETVNDVATSELDIYLLEKAVPRQKNRLGMDYDVLSWWRRNSHKFPVLSEFVKDVLAIQVSFVASESAFSTSGRILDPFRSCLSPHMVESLICTQQWLRNNIHQEKLANLVQMLEELDFHESLVAGSKTVADDADLPP